MAKYYTAELVASHILAWGKEKSISISNLKLQKLLYYVQGWYYALNEEPLFNDDLQAWVHGPVVPSIYEKYRSFSYHPIMDETAQKIDGPVSEKIDQVLNGGYGRLTAEQLEILSHRETPWRETRGNLAPDVSCKRVISKDLIKSFFDTKAAV